MIAVLIQEEEEAIRRLVIAKQANKRGHKREKRMEKAVAALKVCVCVCACVHAYMLVSECV